jgi:hypothetical protein
MLYYKKLQLIEGDSAANHRQHGHPLKLPTVKRKNISFLKTFFCPEYEYSFRLDNDNIFSTPNKKPPGTPRSWPGVKQI